MHRFVTDKDAHSLDRSLSHNSDDNEKSCVANDQLKSVLPSIFLSRAFVVIVVLELGGELWRQYMMPLVKKLLCICMLYDCWGDSLMFRRPFEGRVFTL